ncbi:MAG: tRNA (adenosine(37)-N6)-threonylcarbamoyltransferase complex transferase subunit TsaD [Phycisphaerae bacterium]|nr:tRNA (adenosine(37)-N6)-threonylcarbamoyltransferase complex transferase subunit TsaD [Phycisphaerae bacterium]
MTVLLGIETSCDETSAAVVVDGRDVRSNLIATQFDLHAKYGGVVPEIASRAHIERLDALICEAMSQAGVTPDVIDAIAVTCTPGLIGSLLIGVTAAKTLAWSWKRPLIGVNHIHAHATSAALATAVDPWPAVALVVSGGHSSLFHVRDYGAIELLGCTADDAAGEAFDKVAAILQLGYPGGPIVDRLAREGDPTRIAFPRTMLAEGSLDFSFSGVKTAVLYHVHGPGRTAGGLERLSPQDVRDICASFSAAVVDVLVAKTMLAVARCGVETVVVGGGVAANSMLRSRLAEALAERRLTLHLTPPEFCTDNAAMIAALGYHHWRAGRTSDLSLTAVA